MKITTILMAVMAGILPMMAGTGALGAGAEPRAAFVDAYIYACQPVEHDFAGVQQNLSEAAERVYDEVFRAAYLGSCRDFYYAEVVPLLEVDQRPYFLTVGW